MNTVDDVIKSAAAAFLSWKLPKDFHPDGGVHYSRSYSGTTTGTNLLTYAQAEEMFRHCVQEAVEQLLKNQANAAVPKGWKLLKDTTHEERSYPEEAKSENGAYQCVCSTCYRSFVGHKRRPVCRSCAGTYPAAVEEPLKVQEASRTEAATPEDKEVYKAIADNYFRDAAPHSYAGVTIWKGERSVTQLVSAEQLSHEIARGNIMAAAAKTCLAWLNRD